MYHGACQFVAAGPTTNSDCGLMGNLLIPQALLNRVPEIRQRIVGQPRFRLIAKNNPPDKFNLAAVPYIVDELMNYVVEMSGEELSWKDWWERGFKGCSRVSSNTPDHSQLVRLATDLASEIYVSLQ